MKLSAPLKYLQASITPQTVLSQQRLMVCNSCASQDNTTGRCKHCGCYVDKKVKLPNETCPVGKW